MKDWYPMGKEQSRLQIASIIEVLGSQKSEIVDIGFGDGRLLIPLATAGYTMIGVDRDPAAIEACATHCDDVGINAQLIEGDLFDVLPLKQRVEAILCCGETCMLLSDVDQAVEALRLFRETLQDGGIVVIDDIPGNLWPEVAKGGWANGVNEDASMQFVWAENDAVFALREGDEVDQSSWELGEQDRQFRLWTMGALRLAAKLAGLSAPEVPVAGEVLIMRVAAD